MKRNFVVSLFGSFVGCGLLLILLGVAGSADAHGATTQSGQSASRPVGISIATPLTSTFTYQGQLKSGGVPVNNTCNLQFGLWNSASGGVQVSGTTTQTVPNVSVSNGLLTASIDFGANAFTGDARYLAIAVACPPGSGYVPMSTRQAITAIPYAVLAGNANQLNGQDASAFVTVSGPQTISGPKTFTDGVKFLDGTTQTTAFYRPALPGPGAATTVDTTGIVGQGTSIAIGADGLGLISYIYKPADQLKVYHCDNAACTTGITTTLGNTTWVDGSTSLTIGADGLGLISYWDSINADLKVFHCDNVVCTSGTPTTLDSTGIVGGFAAITTGADGLGLISYYDQTNGDLKVFHCANAICISGTATTLDSTGDVGQYTSLTVGADGLGLISYYDNYNKYLKIFHCSNLACTPHTRVGR